MKNEERLLRIKDIIGDKHAKPPMVGMIPVSRAHWYDGVKKGIYPPSIKVGSMAFWRASDIQNLIVQLAK
jgi:prophage regulatory protein